MIRLMKTVSFLDLFKSLQANDITYWIFTYLYTDRFQSKIVVLDYFQGTQADIG